MLPNKFNLENYNYNLPTSLIAQHPASPRDHSRLLILDKNTGHLIEDHFYNLANYLRAGDLLVINDTKVFPARLIGTKIITQGRVEIFLLNKIKNNIWNCLVKGKSQVGLQIKFKNNLQAELIKDNGDSTWQVRFNLSGDKFMKLVSKIGLTPLPPYIKRDKKNSSDQKNYQTVYADNRQVGSVAAPTAGLHFSPRLLAVLKKKDIETAKVTLHVGLGTFQPVKTVDIREHQIHSEFINIKKNELAKILRARQSKRRIIAVGTTSCRVLETYAQTKKARGWTSIYIYPGYKFQLTYGLISNFHLPKSSLLMLVMALAGERNIKKAYKLAVSKKYRFFSYGDAMLII